MPGFNLEVQHAIKTIAECHLGNSPGDIRRCWQPLLSRYGQRYTSHFIQVYEPRLGALAGLLQQWADLGISARTSSNSCMTLPGRIGSSASPPLPFSVI